jgi:hypothetical protein
MLGRRQDRQLWASRSTVYFVQVTVSFKGVAPLVALKAEE